jgi:hypothetical protein
VTLFKYEQRDAPVLPLRPFLRRMVRHGAIVFEFALLSIAIGMAGFHLFADQAWIDAFLNTAMLLGGMGPVGEIRSTGGKLFAGIFALYAGLAFIVAFAVLTAPVLHRLIHRFHLEERATRTPSRNRSR